MNATERAQRYAIAVEGLPGIAVVAERRRPSVGPAQARWVPVRVQLPHDAAAPLAGRSQPITFRIERLADGEQPGAAWCSRSPPSSCRAEREETTMNDRIAATAVVARADHVARARRPGRRRGGRVGDGGHRDARRRSGDQGRVEQAAGRAGAQPRGHAGAAPDRRPQRQPEATNEAAPDVDRLAGVPRRRRGRDGGVRLRRPAAAARSRTASRSSCRARRCTRWHSSRSGSPPWPAVR